MAELSSSKAYLESHEIPSLIQSLASELINNRPSSETWVSFVTQRIRDRIIQVPAQGRAYMKLVRRQNIESRETLADAIAYSYGCFRTERYCRSPYCVDLICLLRALLSPFDEYVPHSNSIQSNAKKGQYANIFYRLNILLVPKFMRFEVEKQYILSIKSKMTSNGNIMDNAFALDSSFDSITSLSNRRGSAGDKSNSSNADSKGKESSSSSNKTESKSKKSSDSISGMSFADRERKGVEFVIYAVSIRAALLCRRYLLDVREHVGEFVTSSSPAPSSASSTASTATATSTAVSTISMSTKPEDGQLKVLSDILGFFRSIPHHPALTASGLPLHKQSLLEALLILSSSKTSDKGHTASKLEAWIKQSSKPTTNQSLNSSTPGSSSNHKEFSDKPFNPTTFESDHRTQLNILESKLIDVDMVEVAVGAVCEKSLREFSRNAFLENDP